MVIPRLEQLRKEGQAGQAKITQYTRYLTLGLAILQSSAFVALARSGQLFGGCDQSRRSSRTVATGMPDWLTLTILVITMTAGTGVIMWLGELITDRGVGNGMSVLIFTSIAARLPTEGWQIWQTRQVHVLRGPRRRRRWSSPSWSSWSRPSAASRCSTRSG